MNNHALKLVKEKGSVSIKIHDLIKMPEDEFNNLIKQSLYEKAKYYHKSQKGILRVSKYEFYSTKEGRLSSLEKHPIEIISVPKGFDYVERSENEKVWYMNFADNEAFEDRDTKGFKSLNDLQIMEMPLLYKANRFLNTDKYVCISPTTLYKDGNYFCPSPVLFENVPQWITMKNLMDIEKNQIITRDKKNNIIAMKAPFGLYEKYEIGHLHYLCQTLFAGFGGILLQGKKSKITKYELHTGNWGCGNLFKNNKELMYLSQMIVASIMGIQKIYFHAVEENAFSIAEKKFNELENEFSYEQMISFLLQQGYKKS